MSPTLLPLHPILETANTGWKKAEGLMKIFSQIVKRMYGWSDGLIKYRQKRADNKYKAAKAETEAYRIMEEQTQQRQGGGTNDSTRLKRRDWKVYEDWV